MLSVSRYQGHLALPVRRRVLELKLTGPWGWIGKRVLGVDAWAVPAWPAHVLLYFRRDPSEPLRQHEGDHLAWAEEHGVMSFYRTVVGGWTRGFLAGRSARRAYLELPTERRARAVQRKVQQEQERALARRNGPPCAEHRTIVLPGDGAQPWCRDCGRDV